MEEHALKTAAELELLHPADIADYLQRLPAEEARHLLGELPRPLAAEVMTELEPENSAEVMAEMHSEEVGDLLRELPPDEAADLAGGLEGEQRDEALAGMEPEQSAKVNALLAYPEDTAGGIMSDRFIALPHSGTVGECLELLQESGENLSDEDVSYLYVTDQKNRLVGVIPLRELVFRRPDRRIAEVMNREVRFVWVDADQEEIARQFEHYHYLGLPVLERDMRLVGVVRAGSVMEVLQSEATEDMQLMVGLSGEERALTPWHRSIRKRLPWLLVNLGTAFLAASVVGLFEKTIATFTVLAIFLPIVAGQGGNAGMQTLTVIIRDLALGEISSGEGRRALIKECIVGLINGLSIGLVVALISYWWKGDVMLGMVVGLAMVLNMLAAALAGVLIPFGLRAVKIDPALASSIFVTTVTDVAGFFFFLGLATLLLRVVVHP